MPFVPVKSKQEVNTVQGLMIPSEVFGFVSVVDRIDIVDARKIFHILGVDFTSTYVDPITGAVWAETFFNGQVIRTACIYRKREQGKPDVDVITAQLGNKTGSIDLEIFRALQANVIKAYIKELQAILDSHAINR